MVLGGSSRDDGDVDVGVGVEGAELVHEAAGAAVGVGFALVPDPGGLFGFYAARPSSRRARWLVRRLSSGVPVQ